MHKFPFFFFFSHQSWEIQRGIKMYYCFLYHFVPILQHSELSRFGHFFCFHLGIKLFVIVWLKRGNTSLNYTKAKIIVPRNCALTRSHTIIVKRNSAAKTASSSFRLKTLPLRSGQLLSLPYSMRWNQHQTEGGRGTCQHKQRRTACCQWEMSAFIAASSVDPLWTIALKSTISFSQDVAQVITFPKEVMSLSLTSDW